MFISILSNGYNMFGQTLIIYRSKKGTVLYEPLDLLAAITSHIPNIRCSKCPLLGAIQTNQEEFKKNQNKQ